MVQRAEVTSSRSHRKQVVYLRFLNSGGLAPEAMPLTSGKGVLTLIPLLYLDLTDWLLPYQAHTRQIQLLTFGLALYIIWSHVFPLWVSLLAQTVRNLPAMQETWAWSLGWESFLEKGMAIHSSILAWRIPWTEEPGQLQSVGSQRVGCDWVTNTHTHTFLSTGYISTLQGLSYLQNVLHLHHECSMILKISNKRLPSNSLPSNSPTPLSKSGAQNKNLMTCTKLTQIFMSFFLQVTSSLRQSTIAFGYLATTKPLVYVIPQFLFPI